MGIGVFFQAGSDVDDKFPYLRRGLIGVGSRSLGMILIPRGIPGLISMEPFEKPFLRPPHLTINGARASVLQVLFDGHLSQALFFHRITSWVGLMGDIIDQFQPQGNRCIDTNTAFRVTYVLTLLGNLCIDSCQVYGKRGDKARSFRIRDIRVEGRPFVSLLDSSA